MAAKQIDDPAAFLSELGGLHDAEIACITVDNARRVLSFAIEDIHANFDGFPGYDRRPAILEFGSVTHTAIDVDLTAGLMISSVDVRKVDDWFQLVAWRNSGYPPTDASEPPITAKFKSLTVIEPPSPTKNRHWRAWATRKSRRTCTFLEDFNSSG